MGSLRPNSIFHPFFEIISQLNKNLSNKIPQKKSTTQ